VIYGLYLSASGALMESARQSVIANNLANVNTTGFRDDLALIQARNAEVNEKGQTAYATPMDAMGGGALLSETYTRTIQGPIQVTDNPFDMAISGPGFFAVSDGTEVEYTRAGAFVRDQEGRLLMPDGTHYLCDQTGNPLIVPTIGKIAVAKDGTISVDGSAIGAISIYKPANPDDFAKTGANLYTNKGPAVSTSGAGQIQQGALEMSTVSPWAEMTKSILAQRSYEMNMQFIKMEDQTLADLISIGRLSA
jgi:flagellar basal body rod protein FlgG